MQFNERLSGMLKKAAVKGMGGMSVSTIITMINNIYEHFRSFDVWILQQYVPNEEEPPCRASSMAAKPLLKIPKGGVRQGGSNPLSPHTHPFQPLLGSLNVRLYGLTGNKFRDVYFAQQIKS
jgi:acetyl esterase/lipase